MSSLSACSTRTLLTGAAASIVLVTGGVAICIVVVEVDVGTVRDPRATAEIGLGPNGVGDIALSGIDDGCRFPPRNRC